MRSAKLSKAGLIAWAAFAAAMCADAYAEESKAKETAKETGHAIGTAAKETKNVAKEAGKAVADVAREVGHAFRDGAKEVKKAATSDSKPAKPPGPKK